MNNTIVTASSGTHVGRKWIVEIAIQTHDTFIAGFSSRALQGFSEKHLQQLFGVLPVDDAFAAYRPLE